MARLIRRHHAAQNLEDTCEYIGRSLERYAQAFAKRLIA